MGSEGPEQRLTREMRAIPNRGARLVRASIRGLTLLSVVFVTSCGNGSEDPASFKNSIGMEFRQIPPGSFHMGYSKLFGPIHRVTLNGFWMSSYETTNAQFELFRKHKRSDQSLKDNAPVCDVTHEDALKFAQWLSKKEHRKYDLPTEAQWEYAARGVLKGMDYPWGEDDPDGHAVFGDLQTRPVGTFRPNRYGLYDMAGNAAEFVKEADYDYSAAPKTNPVGPLKGNLYISRGGGLDYELKVFERFLVPADMSLPDLGFRLVCSSK